MSAATMSIHTPVAFDASDMEHVVQQLGASVRGRLRAIGVVLADDLLDQLAEDVLADAIHVSLGWLEIRQPDQSPRNTTIGSTPAARLAGR